jgi:hypothetical protein
MAKEGLRNLIESGAAAHRRAPREVWSWAFDAILGVELDAEFPPDARFNTPEIETENWRRLLTSTRESVRGGFDPSFCGWTQNLKLDPDKFNDWLARRCREAPAGRGIPGPVSAQDKMREALEALRAEGEQFTSIKAAYGAVLKRCGIVSKTRGWSLQTFRKAYFPKR